MNALAAVRPFLGLTVPLGSGAENQHSLSGCGKRKEKFQLGIVILPGRGLAGWNSRGVNQMQNPLNAMMTVKPGSLPALVAYLALPDTEKKINSALTQVGTVHFARFLLVPNTNTLFVLTEYDGDFVTYITAFTNLLGDVFNHLFAFIDPAPPLPVQKYQDEFQAYILKNNLQSSLYSAYPQCTVLDIWGNGCAKP
jgi:hypothetical protein